MFIHFYRTHQFLTSQKRYGQIGYNIGGYIEKLEQHVKEKSHSIFSHGHTERNLSYILLLSQSYSELLYGQMIDKYCKKSGPLGYKEELRLTMFGYVSS